MRQDFDKIVTEHGRFRSTQHYTDVRHQRSFDLNDRYFGGREGMKYRHQRGKKISSKTEYWNSRPIRGFLQKNLGRKWDDIYSELCELFDVRSYAKKRFMEILLDEVHVDVFFHEDGRLMHTAYWGGPWEINGNSYRKRPQYYVHPTTKLLCSTADMIRKNQEEIKKNLAALAEEKKKVCVSVSPTLEYRRFNENSPWFACSLRRRPTPRRETKSYTDSNGNLVTYNVYVDPIVYDKWKSYSDEMLFKTDRAKWKKNNSYLKYPNVGNFYCFNIRSASHKELKKHNII